MHDLSQIGVSREQPLAGEAAAEFSADWDGKRVGIGTSAEARNLSTRVAARGDRVDGNLGIDLALSGQTSDPRIGGSISATGGSYRSALTGLSLRDLTLYARGDRPTIGEGSARTPNGGTVRAAESIDIDSDAGRPLPIQTRRQCPYIGAISKSSSNPDGPP
jgi:hypothetical protein